MSPHIGPHNQARCWFQQGIERNFSLCWSCQTQAQTGGNGCHLSQGWEHKRDQSFSPTYPTFSSCRFCQTTLHGDHQCCPYWPWGGRRWRAWPRAWRDHGGRRHLECGSCGKWQFQRLNLKLIIYYFLLSKIYILLLKKKDHFLWRL